MNDIKLYKRFLVIFIGFFQYPHNKNRVIILLLTAIFFQEFVSNTLDILSSLRDIALFCKGLSTCKVKNI